MDNKDFINTLKELENQMEHAARRFENCKDTYLRTLQKYRLQQLGLIPEKSVLTHKDKEYLFVGFQDILNDRKHNGLEITAVIETDTALKLALKPFKKDGSLSDQIRYLSVDDVNLAEVR